MTFCSRKKEKKRNTAQGVDRTTPKFTGKKKRSKTGKPKMVRKHHITTEELKCPAENWKQTRGGVATKMKKEEGGGRGTTNESKDRSERSGVSKIVP